MERGGGGTEGVLLVVEEVVDANVIGSLKKLLSDSLW